MSGSSAEPSDPRVPGWVAELAARHSRELAAATELTPTTPATAKDSLRLGDSLRQAARRQASHVHRTLPNQRAREAAEGSGRLPISAPMVRTVGGKWTPENPQALTPAQRRAMGAYSAAYARHRRIVIAVRRPACRPRVRARRRREGVRSSARSGDSGSAAGDPSGEGEPGPYPLASQVKRALFLGLSSLFITLETPRRDPWAHRELPLGLWRVRASLCRRLEALEAGR